jgi:hypothetical protein
MQNKLVVVGYLGSKIAYLNISKEEAIKRFNAEVEFEIDVAECV